MGANLTGPLIHSGQPPTSRPVASFENRSFDAATIVTNADAQLVGIVVDFSLAPLCLSVLKAVSDRWK
jgi:hypothetical protein